MLAFCEDTWEWGDYIPWVWDDWLADAEGKLLVASLNTQRVGLGHARLLAPEEAWLEGLRVAPEQRGKGIATALTRRLIEVAGGMGATVVRFATASTNIQVHRVAAALRFRRVAAFVPHHADPTPGRAAALVPKSVPNLPAVLSFLQKSPVYSSTAGLCCIGWAYHRLTAVKLEKQLTEGAVLAVGSGQIQALAIVQRSEYEGLVVCYVDGSAEALGTLAFELRAEAGQRGLARVSPRLPDLPYILEAFAAAGYSRDFEGSFWVFQREVEKPARKVLT